MPAALTGLAPDAILERFDAYRGRFVDAEREASLDGEAMRAVAARVGDAVGAMIAPAGARAIVAVGNGPLFPVAIAAMLRVGVSPLMVHADTPEAELARVARQWRCALLVADGLGAEPGDGVIDAGAAGRLVVRATGCFGAPDAFPASPLHQTSGTSGTPKVALRHAAAAVAEAENYARAMAIDEADTVMCVSPMSHAYAYGMAFMVPLVTGADCVALRRFNPRMVRSLLASEGASIAPLTPAMLPLLLQELRSTGDRLRLVLSAGAPLTVELAKRFRDATGHTPRRLLGTTETGGIAVASEDDADAGCGAAMEGVAVRIDDAGLSAGHGRLFVRSRSMMAGYLDENGIAPAVDEDGWYATGDLARLDDAARIHLGGRTGDVVNVLGFKVLPLEVEEVLRELPGVADVAVYAGSHRGTEAVFAAIVRDPEGAATGVPTSEDIHRACARLLVAHKRPARVVFLDELPRGPSGKVLTRALPEALDRATSDAAPSARETNRAEPTKPPAGRLLYLMNDFVVQEHVCNLRCTYCLNFENENLKPGAPWKPSERVDLLPGGFGWQRARDVLGRSAELGDAPILRMAGGEIMAIKGALDFVEEMAERWHRVQILTNATFLTRDIGRLRLIPNLNLCCSLDGFTPEHNSERTPNPKWGQRIIDGVVAAIEAGVPVEVYCVLNRSNVEAIYEFAQWLDALPRRADVRLLPFPVRGDAAATYLFEQGQLGGLERLVADHARFSEILPPKGYLERLLRMARGATRTDRCRVPLSFLQTFDDGVVAACSNCWAASLGNILEDERALEAVGRANIHKLFLRTPPRISFCNSCFTPFDVVNVYLDGQCTLEEIGAMDLYSTPPVLARLEQLKSAWCEGGREAVRIPSTAPSRPVLGRIDAAGEAIT